ncbi:hypothetical protein B0H13DRAFT_1854806 [Mycena leptocephala]|nr:hypothetical protein B0H13DRAFT_1854806 [Mycena leptocephala]
MYMVAIPQKIKAIHLKSKRFKNRLWIGARIAAAIQLNYMETSHSGEGVGPVRPVHAKFPLPIFSIATSVFARVHFWLAKVACARAEWLVLGVGVDYFGGSQAHARHFGLQAILLAWQAILPAWHQPKKPKWLASLHIMYRGHQLSHNFNIWRMLVVTMKNDEGNSYPTCKPAGL